MEIEGLEEEDGSKTQLNPGFKRELGRGLGFDSNDRTVSRRHVSLELEGTGQRGPNSKSSVRFEVTGKNPIWVCSEDGEIRVFRRSQRGEMAVGDLFCVSGKNPVWFGLKRAELDDEDEVGDESELAESLETGSGLNGVEDMDLEDVDVSDVDPVKEFGFLVMGHEFDHYPKKMIRDAKTWNWFLDEPEVESDDSDDNEISERKRKKGSTSKRKKGHGNDDDDDWTGESDEDKELITKSRKVQKPKYSTRSKDRDKSKSIKDAKDRGNKEVNGDETEEEDETEKEDDETLGGFIVDEDEDVVKEDENDEEEEEDFDEDDDE